MADDCRRIILERRAAFVSASLAALAGAGCAPSTPARGSDAPVVSPEARAEPSATPPAASAEPPAMPAPAPPATGSPTEPAPRVIVRVCLSIAVAPKVTFAEGSTTPLPEGRDTIEQTAKILHEHPNVRLAIEGHRVAGEGQGVSRARAARVEADLAAAGVDPERLCLEDRGDERPIAPPAEPSSRAKNRRVEFRVLDEAEGCDDPGMAR